MGYDAFRGMIRPEFKRIHRAYSAAMDELGITRTIHPELRKIWRNDSLPQKPRLKTL